MTLRVIVLGAGRGTRRLDARRSEPAALVPVGERGPVLDWLLQALREDAGSTEITYIGGYHIEKVVERYPGLYFRYHRTWQEDGELGALQLADDLGKGASTLLVRADTVVLPGAVRQLVAAGPGNVVGVRGGGGGRMFAGILLLSPDAALRIPSLARKALAESPSGDLDDFVELLRKELDLSELQLDGLVAPLEDRVAVAQAVFRGKGHALDHLGKVARTAQVVDLLRVPVVRWREDPDSVFEEVSSAFIGRRVVVRSSAVGEDGLHSSGAGIFRTELGVPADSREEVGNAFESVIASYSRHGRQPAHGDEVLVQPQLSDLSMSGVLFTRDLTSGAPYFVVSADSSSGRSDVVTSGSGDAEVSTHYILWGSGPPVELPHGTACLQLGSEIVSLTGIDALDIEFAFGTDGAGYLFQARPMASLQDVQQRSDEDFLDLVHRARSFVADRMTVEPMLAGSSTVLGVMPDWNPAEMIGRSPRPLTLSLYQRLIGDLAWAEARSRMGYRDARPHRLVLSIGGSPYVDVRASLNSLLPAGLPADFEETWIDGCLDRLRSEPALHDKIEFELLPTCLAPGFDEWALPRLSEAGLQRAAIQNYRRRLVELTEGVVLGKIQPISSQLDLVAMLEDRRERILRLPVSEINGAARRAALMLDDCVWYGTVPFAILARHAFIGLAILRGLTEVGVLDDEDVSGLLRCVPTVASELAADMVAHGEGQHTQDEMLHKYGHLRPGSYDITAPRYGSDPDRFLRPAAGAGYEAPEMSEEAARDRLLQRRERAVQDALKHAGLDLSAQVVVAFVQNAVAARERAKFEFMKNVDAAIESIAALGEVAGLDREHMSFIPVDFLLRYASESTTEATAAQLQREAGFQRKRWELTCALRLPDVIREPEDVMRFTLDVWRPNFVTRECIEAPLVYLDDQADTLTGRIVLVESADPGYDWIFGHRIAGLITKYGGAASHMAIRAAEFGIPAAIGCGEHIFERLRGAARVELDCLNGRVRVR